MLTRPSQLIILFIVFHGFIKSQDTTKKINHEIGFNTVLLVKQLLSNNPTSTLQQSPYLIFYNLYFKDKAGIRAGLGLFTNKIKTTIEGQPEPRLTVQNSVDLRLGFSYNFLKQNRITFNAFIDGIYGNSSFHTTNTQTIMSTPGTGTITATSEDATTNTGGQAGIGVKYNLHKYLSLYIEVPVRYIASSTKTETKTTRTSFPDQKNSSKSASAGSDIMLPTTLYLVLRF